MISKKEEEEMLNWLNDIEKGLKKQEVNLNEIDELISESKRCNKDLQSLLGALP